MAEEGVVVEVELGVERQDFVVRGLDQGIDLEERAIGGDEELVEGLEDLQRALGRLGAELEGLGEAVRADVRAKFAVDLEWEIKRIGRI